jgi:hypothetical protein
MIRKYHINLARLALFTALFLAIGTFSTTRAFAQSNDSSQMSCREILDLFANQKTRFVTEAPISCYISQPDGLEICSSNVPIIRSVSPNIGPLSGGQIVRLTGEKFGASTEVTVGGIVAVFASQGADTIFLLTPPGTAGSASIVIGTPSVQNEPNGLYTYVDTIRDTQEAIAPFIQSRASQTIASQPDLIGFLSGASTGSFNADVTQSNGNFDFATSGDQPVWATLQGSWSEFGTAESSYFFGAVGAHTNLSPDALVGIMFEFDKLTQTDGATSVEGDGYLVGPYFVAKLPNQPLFIEGRLLTGQTENKVSVNGAATETFETQRRLALIKVAGQLNYGELVLTPSLTATHLRDAQGAFENTLGNTVAAQGIEVNSVAAGLNFAQPVSLSNGELMLTGGISGIWSSSEGTGFASSVAPTTDGLRARITLGVSHTLPNGAVLSAGSFYDGIGMNDYESYGLNLGVQMQF